MELSSRDINTLEKAGYSREKFTVKGEKGINRLRNIDGHCFFYNRVKKKCQVYELRPIGCYTYPVVYSADEGIIIDELCPMGDTVSAQEFKTKGWILINLLNTIDNERSSNAENRS
jgi:Fe-S-cluster containining protein